MKTAMFSACAAVVLFIAGVVCWSAGRVERGTIDARRELARLAYAESIKEDAAVESRGGVSGLVPMTTAALERLREQRGSAQYWLGEYPMLAPPRDPEG